MVAATNPLVSRPWCLACSYPEQKAYAFFKYQIGLTLKNELTNNIIIEFVIVIIVYVLPAWKSVSALGQIQKVECHPPWFVLAALTTAAAAAAAVVYANPTSPRLPTKIAAAMLLRLLPLLLLLLFC